MDADNTWYYTLSTISQTLAAIMGFGAIFFVLRLEGINKNIAVYKNRALDILLSAKKHINFNIQSFEETDKILVDIKNFKNYYETLKPEEKNSGVESDFEYIKEKYAFYKNLNNFEFISDTENKFNYFVDQRNAHGNSFFWPSVFTLVTIALSIITLCLSCLGNTVAFLKVIIFLIILTISYFLCKQEKNIFKNSKFVIFLFSIYMLFFAYLFFKWPKKTYPFIESNASYVLLVIITVLTVFSFYSTARACWKAFAATKKFE